MRYWVDKDKAKLWELLCGWCGRFKRQTLDDKIGCVDNRGSVCPYDCLAANLIQTLENFDQEEREIIYALPVDDMFEINTENEHVRDIIESVRLYYDLVEEDESEDIEIDDEVDNNNNNNNNDSVPINMNGYVPIDDGQEKEEVENADVPLSDEF